MRYRKLTADGDYSFGQQQADFYRDTPDAVAQAVLTRLQLFTGQWFLDNTEGTPWRTEVLGKYTQDSYDSVIQARILDTQGVTQIDAYSSTRDADNRVLSVAATISTAYGQTTITTTL
ncbi:MULTISPECIES: hypothetical protein [Achromobacter]|uniref:hypothetical protein n=1 Tax=Achromobacter TaxID=222 RepID=UPI001F129349|nr:MULTISPECIES: hypothetical protein [Achromobacter]